MPGAAIVVRNAFVQHYRDTAAGRLRGGGGAHSGRGGSRPDRGFVLAIDRVRSVRCAAHEDMAVLPSAGRALARAPFIPPLTSAQRS